MNLDVNSNAVFVLQHTGRVQEAMVRTNWKTEWYELWGSPAMLFLLSYLNEDGQTHPEIRKQLMGNYCNELAAHLDYTNHVFHTDEFDGNTKQNRINTTATLLQLEHVGKELRRRERSMLNALELNSWCVPKDTPNTKPKIP